jgi:hypothetical protein
MTIPTSLLKPLLTIVCGAALASGTAVIQAPPAAAACPGGTILDPRTGICWSQVNPSNSYGGSGNIPCLPGRLGLCLGALQNTPIPGAALQPQPGAGPAPRSGPRGTWP